MNWRIIQRETKYTLAMCTAHVALPADRHGAPARRLFVQITRTRPSLDHDLRGPAAQATPHANYLWTKRKAWRTLISVASGRQKLCHRSQAKA
jgi:hypothetical protein